VWAAGAQPDGHNSDEVNSVAFSPDGTRIVSGSEDNLVEIWDTATGAEVSSHARALGEAWQWIGFPGEGKLRFQAWVTF